MRLLSLVLPCMLATATYAQEGNKNILKPVDTSTINTQPMDKVIMDECYMLKDNKMWYCHASSYNPLVKDVTLNNGTLITKKGQVIAKDGKTQMLKEGQCVDLSGNISECGNAFPKENKETPPNQK